MENKIKLNIGDKVPDFSLQDSENNETSLKNYSGQKVVIYFYPAADTPGCTTEACDFRDNLTVLNNNKFKVIGISPDSIEKLQKFKTKYSLNFPLLSDEENTVSTKFGAYGEKNMYGKKKMGIIRSTFIIDEKGRIEDAQYNVKATGHVNRLIEKLQAV